MRSPKEQSCPCHSSSGTQGQAGDARERTGIKSPCPTEPEPASSGCAVPGAGLQTRPCSSPTPFPRWKINKHHCLLGFCWFVFCVCVVLFVVCFLGFFLKSLFFCSSLSNLESNKFPAGSWDGLEVSPWGQGAPCLCDEGRFVPQNPTVPKTRSIQPKKKMGFGTSGGIQLIPLEIPSPCRYDPIATSGGEGTPVIPSPIINSIERDQGFWESTERVLFEGTSLIPTP